MQRGAHAAAPERTPHRALRRIELGWDDMMRVYMTADRADVSGLVERLADGDIRALARAVSLVEDGGALAGDIVNACRGLGRRSRRIGITGAPGAGKSTLADALVTKLRADGERVGVIAVDPTSPYTGGALLGDRIRMQGFGGDTGVFIRSMASRGALGGVSTGVDGVCAVLEAASYGTLLIETVGVGQDEVAVTRLADVTVLVLVPGMGDDVQSLKAGVMEAADIFVVNKADLDGADRVEAEIRAMQSLTGETRPVLRTVASSGAGVGELIAVVASACADRADGNGSKSKQRHNTGVLRCAQNDEVSWQTQRLSWCPSPSEGLQLDHLGVAVRSIAAARGFYEALGLRVAHEETVEHEQVKTAMLPLGESRIELLEATAEDSTIGRFLSRRGEGLHHIALKVDRIDERFAEMKAAGTRLASDAVRVGAGGHRYFFVHPASTGGVLIELVGE